MSYEICKNVRFDIEHNILSYSCCSNNVSPKEYSQFRIHAKFTNKEVVAYLLSEKGWIKQYGENFHNTNKDYLKAKALADKIKSSENFSQGIYNKIKKEDNRKDVIAKSYIKGIVTINATTVNQYWESHSPTMKEDARKWEKAHYDKNSKLYVLKIAGNECRFHSYTDYVFQASKIKFFETKEMKKKIETYRKEIKEYNHTELEKLKI